MIGLGIGVNIKGSEALFGPELITTGWNTVGLAWWNTHDANWSGDGSALISNNNGFLVKGITWYHAKSYLVVSTAVVTSGYYRIYDGADYTGSDICYESKTYSKIYSPPYDGNITINSWAFVGQITALSIKEIL